MLFSQLKFVQSLAYLWLYIQFSTQPESEFLLVISLMTVIHQNLWYGKFLPSSEPLTREVNLAIPFS